MPATLSKVAATIFFLKKDPKHEKEKPYAFRYAADINIPKTNFELKEYNNVMIEDIRDRLWSFTIEQNGFCVLELSNEIHYEDYFDFTKVETYFHQLESLLKDHLQALSVNVFRHAVSVSPCIHFNLWYKLKLKQNQDPKKRSRIPCLFR